MSKTKYRNGAPDLDKSSIDYEAIQDPGHMHSVGAWIGVILVFVGVAVAGIGTLIVNTSGWALFFVGCAVVVLGAVVGPVLVKAGLGPKIHHNTLQR